MDLLALRQTTVVGQVLGFVLWLFFIALIARVVLSYVFMFARDYTPTGPMLLIVESVYTVTDPPLKFLRRFIPPLRLGNVALDLSLTVLMLLVFILMSSVAPLL